MIEDMPLEILPIAEVDQKRAIKLLRRFADQNLTLTDALGLHTMDARRIKPAGRQTFTWD
jgi:hypothetical protein